MTPHATVFDLRMSLHDVVSRFSRFREHWTEEDRRAVSDALRLISSHVAPPSAQESRR